MSIADTATLLTAMDEVQEVNRKRVSTPAWRLFCRLKVFRFVFWLSSDGNGFLFEWIELFFCIMRYSENALRRASGTIMR